MLDVLPGAVKGAGYQSAAPPVERKVFFQSPHVQAAPSVRRMSVSQREDETSGPDGRQRRSPARAGTDRRTAASSTHGRRRAIIR
jgi:hypothetical protein